MNVQAPMGFIPRFAQGGESGRVAKYVVSAANSPIGKGDLLRKQSDGTVDHYDRGTGQVIGVAAHAVDSLPNGGEVLVYDNPDQVYSIQVSGPGAAALISQSTMGNNADVVAGGPSNGVSTQALDPTTAAFGAGSETLPVRVIGLLEVAGNTFGEYNELLVKINVSGYKAGTEGAV